MTKSKDPEVKIIRLVTGEDVVGKCTFDDKNEYVLLIEPMTVIIDRMNSQGKSILMMLPWLPVEVLEENMSMISYDNILAIMNPRDSFVEYYTNHVEKFNDLDKVETDDLDELIGDDLLDEEPEDEEDEFLKHVLTTEQKKSRTIH
jgi:hypothetical protein